MVNRTIPIDAHKLNGTFRKHRHETAESNGTIDIPDEYPAMPEFLWKVPLAVDVWHRIKVTMEASRIYNEADANKLARYCVLQARFEESLGNDATAKARTYSKGGKRKNSGDFDDNGDEEQLIFGAALLAQLRFLERDLYLDPEMRSKIGTKKKKTSNPFGQFK